MSRSTAGLLQSQQRLVVLLALGLAVAGMLCWVLMPRQEDPTFPNRNALVVVALPGADTETIERQIVLPVEEQLAEVPEINRVQATIRPDVAIVSIQLSDTIDTPAPIWDDVEDALEEAAADFPAATLPWRLNSDLTDLESVVVAVTGSDDLMVLQDAAEQAADRLRAVSGVKDVVWTADPGEQVVVALDESTARSIGLPPGQLAAQLEALTAATPAGTLSAGGRRLAVDAQTSVTDLDRLRQLSIPVGSGGATVPLGSLASIHSGPVTPLTAHMRIDGQTAVGLGVVPRPGIDVVALGEEVDAALAELSADLAPLSLVTVTHQPERVQARLADLGGSLAQGVFIVGGVLVVFMGLRLGSVVALIVPVVTFSSLALYAAFGGVLQQISIAALVLSLGLLVDNAIVIAEQVQRRIDEGVAPWPAAIGTVRELAVPLASATGTTIASFMPLLLSTGTSGDFTRAIPQLVILTLVVSFAAAITLTPTLAALLFAPSRPKADSPARQRLAALGARIAALPSQRPAAILAASVGLVVLTGALSPLVPQQFFPGGDRNQLVVEVELAEGTHLATTDAAIRLLEADLLQRPEVVQVAAFVGRSTPAFYYNLARKPDAPQLGQLLVRTQSAEDVAPLQGWLRQHAPTILPGVTVVARTLEQGPPTPAPVELRFVGDDLDTLWSAATELHAVLRDIPGAVDVRHDLGTGTPTLALEPSDAALARHSLSRRDLALAVLGRTRGLPAGELRRDGELVPIVVRDAAGEDLSVARLETVDLWSPASGPVPLAAVASSALTLRPSVIRRRNGQRRVSVMAQLAPGVSFSEVLAAAQPRARDIAQRHGLILQTGGDAEGSGEANRSIFVAAPIGGGMLLAFLLGQFRSFRKVGIVLLTVPLAATGVIPGLLLAGQPFGFTSLLGLFALIGIVVNNAIILIDAIDTRRAEGMGLEDAVVAAVTVRTRPILLTTLTTMVGMAPLLVSSSTLWPPLASALMSGLAASTGLTLLVVPAAYVLLFGPRPPWLSFGRLATAAAVLLLLPLPVRAETVTLQDALSSAEAENLDLTRVRALEAAAQAAAGEAWALLLPRVRVQGTYTRNREEQALDFSDSLAQIDLPQTSDLEPLFAAFHDPAQVAAVFDALDEEPATLSLDPIVVREEGFFDASAAVQVPLFDPAAYATVGAARASARAQDARTADAQRQIRLGVTRAFYSVRVADQAVVLAGQALSHARDQHSLAARQVEVGASASIIAVQGELAVVQAERRLAEAQASAVTARAALSTLTGLPADIALAAPPAPDTPSLTPTQPQPPSVLAADWQLTAARRAVRAEQLGALPRLDGTFQWTWTQNQGFQDEPTYWVALVSATWTPVTGGQRLFATRGAIARAEAAQAAASLAQRQAVEAEENAIAALTASTAALSARQREVVLAEEAERLAEEAFAAGAGDWLTLQGARLTAEEARLGLAVGEMEQAVAIAALAAARG